MNHDNPFEVLRLDPTVPDEEVVRQAGRLRQRAGDEATVAAIRQAVQALIGRPEERLVHALLTHPAPCHAFPTLDRLTTAFRRPPMPTVQIPPACPAPDLSEVASLLRPLAAAEFDVAAPPFESVGEADDTVEIVKQTIEGLWQALPFDTRA